MTRHCLHILRITRACAGAIPGTAISGSAATAYAAGVGDADGGGRPPASCTAAAAAAAASAATEFCGQSAAAARHDDGAADSWHARGTTDACTATASRAAAVWPYVSDTPAARYTEPGPRQWPGLQVTAYHQQVESR